MRKSHFWTPGILVLCAACGACSSDATSTTGTTASSASASGSSSSSGGGGTDCTSAATYIEKVTCAAEAFMATLTDAERSTVLLDWTDSVAKTRWSNLPGAARNGLRLGDLDADSLAAAKAVADAVLTDDGYKDFEGVLAADDYLGSQSGGGPGGGMYSSANYYIAFLGAPSTTGSFMVQIGGHHLAINVTYVKGTGYPTPNHLGVEPKGSFTVNSATFAPLDDDVAAMLAIFKSFNAAQLDAAYLTGQTFADVLVGPDEYETGKYPTGSYPMGANRTGVLASSLTAEQQELIKQAMEQWVRDYEPEIADPLIADYTSTDAYADTYIAWGGTKAAGIDPDTNGTYMRIDGPRAWVEVSCQAGVVIKGKTHYHTIFRDKVQDYGQSL